MTIVRPFNTYGPRQSARAVIPTIITQLLTGHTEIKLGSLAPHPGLQLREGHRGGLYGPGGCEAAVGQEVNIATGESTRSGSWRRS